MTPKMDRQIQREQEMARGREVAARAARTDTIIRWIRARKIDLFFDSGRVRVYVGEQLVATCDDGKDYPTEFFVAQIGLAIRALKGFDGVALADPPPSPKSASALHVAAAQKRLREWTQKRLRELNGKN